MNKRLIGLFAVFTIGTTTGVYAESSDSRIIGEVFGRPVTQAEFADHYKSVSMLARRGRHAQTEEERRQSAWENLIYLHEADRMGIEVEPEKVEAELRSLLSGSGIEYGSERYPIWVKSALREDVQTFEKRVENMLRIEQFKKAPIDVDVTVTDEEIKQKFLNQQNSFECEYIMFDTADEAQAFRSRFVRDPSPWKETYDRKRKNGGQKGASWINMMSIEAMIDLWKIPRKDSYRIHSARLGDFVLGENIYGSAVFRLLNKRNVDMERFTSQKKESLRDVLTRSKKYQAGQEYLKKLIAGSGKKDYVQERKSIKEVTQVDVGKKTVENAIVVLKTNQGDIKIKLHSDAAPKACENFMKLAEKGYYNELIFHRVIKGFMIQGGDPTGTGRGGQSIWGKAFEDEFSAELKFDRPGLLAMANSGPHTNGSQFFITTVPTPWLTNRHTIFGEVIEGMDVVTKIENSPTGAGDKPKEDQKILEALVE